MHALCNYLLTADRLTANKALEIQNLAVGAIEEWLSEKGAEYPTLPKGIFNSLTPEGGGSFTRTQLDGADSFAPVMSKILEIAGSLV